MNIHKLIYQVRGAIFKVHRVLEPGLPEAVYEAALAYELVRNGIKVKTQAGLPVVYENVQLELGFRRDILVEDMLVIEIKSVELLHNLHKKQLLRI